MVGVFLREASRLFCLRRIGSFTTRAAVTITVSGPPLDAKPRFHQTGTLASPLASVVNYSLALVAS